jgi:hypothetical protein|nr:MAG TPA: Lsm interaction motif [Caudoviricetes sp.]
MTNKEFRAILRTLREGSGISQYIMIKDDVIDNTTKL